MPLPGLYGRAFGSLLVGDFRTTLGEVNNNGASIISLVGEHYRKVVPVTELGIGVSWKRDNLRARIGYEIVDWIGLADSPDLIHDFTNKLGHRVGDVSLDGLDVRFEYEY